MSLWVFKWPGRPIIEEIEGDVDCVANFVDWKLSAGAAGRHGETENTYSR
jgi:hypothetical protein